MREGNKTTRSQPFVGMPVAGEECCEPNNHSATLLLQLCFSILRGAICMVPGRKAALVIINILNVQPELILQLLGT